MGGATSEAPVGRLGERVVQWQRVHGRHGLPWQNSRDAYRVWLSEVMLQQTQVGTVLAYFDRFLARFPDVQALAAAPQDDVLALWSGLGYYSRARNLHRCAQAVVAAHGGQFPRDSATLATLPGIGRSTAAAIAAFAFGERAAILDGNVKRVLGRALGFAQDVSTPAGERALWKIATDLLPEQGIEAYTQGLMDLGATVCTLRKPRCEACPLQDDCVARREGQPLAYPVKGKRLKRSTRENAWLWLQRGPTLWLTRRPESGVWAGLWSLPEWPADDTLDALAAGWPGQGEWLPPLRHALTHFDWTLHTLRWQLPEKSMAAALAPVEAVLPPGRWFSVDEALASGVPTPLRRLLSA